MKKILLISHELSQIGAPIMLLEAAKILLQQGHSVTVIALMDGSLREEFYALGIDVLVIKMGNKKSECLCAYAKAYDLVIINTFVCVGAVKSFVGTQIPVLWWIHEGEYVIPFYKNILPESLSSNFHLICVSKYTQKVLGKYFPMYYAKILYNGIRDVSISDCMDIPAKMFVCTGSIEKRKGQDILLKAIERIADAGIQNYRFLFIGSVLDDEIKNELDNYCNRFSFISYYPVMPRQDLLKIVKSATAVIVPSRDDPSPLVAGEAMMLGTPVIVSDKTGTAGLIEDRGNGLIFENESVEDLANKIAWCADNPEQLKKIGICGTKIYHDYYEMNVFSRNFLKLVSFILFFSSDNKLGDRERTVMNEMLLRGVEIEQRLTDEIALRG